jgi:hypothetical protein
MLLETTSEPDTDLHKTGKLSIKLQARSRNHYYHGKAISITYAQSVSVVLVIYHEMRMCRIVLSSVVLPALLYFRHYPVNDTIFRIRRH